MAMTLMIIGMSAIGLMFALFVYNVCASMSDSRRTIPGASLLFVAALYCGFIASYSAPPQLSPPTTGVVTHTYAYEIAALRMVSVDGSPDYLCTRPVCRDLEPGDIISYQTGRNGYAFVKGRMGIHNVTRVDDTQ